MIFRVHTKAPVTHDQARWMILLYVCRVPHKSAIRNNSFSDGGYVANSSSRVTFFSFSHITKSKQAAFSLE